MIFCAACKSERPALNYDFPGGLSLPGIETFSCSPAVVVTDISGGQESYLSPLLPWSPPPPPDAGPPPAILQTLQPIKPELLRDSQGCSAIKTEPLSGQEGPRLVPTPLNRLLEYPLPSIPTIHSAKPSRTILQILQILQIVQIKYNNKTPLHCGCVCVRDLTANYPIYLNASESTLQIVSTAIMLGNIFICDMTPGSVSI